MTCQSVTSFDPLSPLGFFLVAALTIGCVVLLFAPARANSRLRGGLMIPPIVGVAVVASLVLSPAATPTPECGSSDGSLTITQASTFQLLAPGVESIPVAGTVVNNGTEETFIGSVEVSIDSVTQASDSVPGACGVGDYELRDSTMSVDRMLEAGGALSFEGASLGFANKPSNQDACQRATVNLIYVVVAH